MRRKLASVVLGLLAITALATAGPSIESPAKGNSSFGVSFGQVPVFDLGGGGDGDDDGLEDLFVNWQNGGENESNNGTETGTPNGTASGGEGNILSQDGLPLTQLALGALVVLLVLGLIYRRRKRGQAAQPDEFEDDTADEIAAVAGETADRLAEPGHEASENEIYRAWREMTDILDISSPRTSTPAEFARAASDIGFPTEDVEELSDLFAAVRYGNVAPTEEREERAIDVLRRIERHAS